MTHKHKILLVGIAISIAFVYFIAKNIEIDKVKASFSDLNYLFILPSFLTYLFSFVLRSFRWRYLLEHEKRVPFKSLFSILMIGFMANQILPARIGEFARGYCMGKKENISKSLSFGTVVIERLWDALTLLFLLNVIFFIFPLPSIYKKINIIGAIVFLSILVFMILLTFKKGLALNIFAKITFFLPDALKEKVSHLLTMFIDGFKVLHTKKYILLVSILSVLIWLTESTFFYILIRAFHLSLPFYGALLLIIIINVGVMIPASPGQIGTLEGFCILGLSFFGISKEAGLSYSIVLHALISIPTIVIGLLFLWKENISFKEISKTT